jgi:hypothetical protein
MQTTVNGKETDWTPEIWQKWYTFADMADPKLSRGTVRHANYFTPRPYRNEYDRGSGEEGFVFTLTIPDRVLPTVWQVVIAKHPVSRVGSA